jgi:hypothetical protein
MEPRLSLGRLLCASVAIVFGVSCLYPSAVSNRAGREVHRRHIHEHAFVYDGASAASKRAMTQIANAHLTTR